jgi:hypothetical protein
MNIFICTEDNLNDETGLLYPFGLQMHRSVGTDVINVYNYFSSNYKQNLNNSESIQLLRTN